MNIFGSIIRAGMTPEEKALWERLQKMIHSGEITQEEAERQQAELADAIRKTFDGEQDKA